MKGMKVLLLALVAVLAGCASGPPPSDGINWQTRAPGVSYVQYAPVKDSVVQALRIDLQTPGVQVRLSPQSEKGRTLPDMPSGAGALVSVNASFFNKQYEPRGLTVSEGEAWDPISAVQTSPLIACDDKPRCVIQLHAPFALQPGWRNVVAGTPWLLDQGKVRTAADDETCKGHCAATHPRTAVGLDASGRYLYLVVCEGRRAPVLGLSLAQLSAVMLQLGAHQALNLDGGGSSTLMLDGKSVLERPFNEPQLRKVGNALHVFIPANR